MLAFQAGEQAAFVSIVERYQRRVYNYLLRCTGDPEAARDLLQATFERMIEAAPRWEPRSRLSTWVYTIATNLARDRSRRAASQPDTRAFHDGSTAAAGGAGPERAAARGQLRAGIVRAVRNLPAHEREAFVLGKYEGRSYDEIAQILGCSEGAVKVRVHRAMKRLQTALAEWIR